MKWIEVLGGRGVGREHSSGDQGYELGDLVVMKVRVGAA